MPLLRAHIKGSRRVWQRDIASFRAAAEARWLTVLLVSALCLTTAILLWVTRRAIEGWKNSTALLAQRRADEDATLLNIALDRDMNAVQVTVLGRLGERRLDFKTPYDLVDLVASTFARFPYPDSMFVWRHASTGNGHLYVFSRAKRVPRWDRERQVTPPSFPVVVNTDPDGLTPLISTIRAQNTREQFVVNEFEIAGRRYQAVMSLFFDSPRAREPSAAVGFLVDLDWIRLEYFGELLHQVESVIQDDNVSLSILDERAGLVATTKLGASGRYVVDRVFPLAFFDQGLLAAQQMSGSIPQWTLRVTLNGALGSVPRLWGSLGWLAACASSIALVGAILVGNVLRATADLAVAKSEFVSTVTHELKTPLALIRMVGETIGLGRYTSSSTIDRYGTLLSTEVSRLTLQIDNLLEFARATDAPKAYHFESVDLLEVIHESVRRAEPRLRQLGFEIDTQLTEAPLVKADRAGLLHVIDNLVDNAIKYSPASRVLTITTYTDSRFAFFAVEDRGIGIAESDRDNVFEKFFRGKNASAAGSGLGLAIVRRVVASHRGTVNIRSQIKVGTIVTVGIPLSDPS